MKAFSLCHNARINTPDGMFESARKEEVNILEFAKLCDFTFEMYDKDEYMRDLYFMKNAGLLKKYEIIALNTFSYSRGRFSIACKESTSNDAHDKFPIIRESENENETMMETGSTLYCKGSFDSMRHVLDLDQVEQEYLDETIQELNRQGLKCIVYAKRELSKRDTEDVAKKYQNLKFSLMSQNNQLEELAVELESKLKFIGVIALRDDLVEGVHDMLSFFREINTKVWLVSGDGEGNDDKYK